MVRLCLREVSVRGLAGRSYLDKVLLLCHGAQYYPKPYCRGPFCQRSAPKGLLLWMHLLMPQIYRKIMLKITQAHTLHRSTLNKDQRRLSEGLSRFFLCMGCVAVRSVVPHVFYQDFRRIHKGPAWERSFHPVLRYCRGLNG